MLGGLLLAAVDTEGKPGVAWRAKHAAPAYAGEAKHLHPRGRLRGKARRQVADLTVAPSILRAARYASRR